MKKLAKKLNKYIDHTLLKPEASLNDIRNLCQEALEHDFASVCVNSYFVKECNEILKDSDVKVCTVVGFPLGASTSETKVAEISQALSDGATEIDMVLNISAFKSSDYDYVINDMKKCKAAVGDKVLKVILETSLLNDKEIKKACELAKEAKVDFVKTSTGFNGGGATVHHIKIMKAAVGNDMCIKASGGVKTRQDAIDMIVVGADRIGTSGGVQIVKGEANERPY
ncbi:deoxyribose-phosphate aldolase [Spiroplasma endosymbiont of Anurida maritima]|uniref:deoxyribose-phosphate aldolase n=1 Tax=Spiroplasma endosymbiont of Anurida maritima TaxID=2967972 RepID=UPI0036D39442